MKRTHALNRVERLKRKADFDKVCKQGRAHRTKELVVMSLPNETPCSRLGMVVGQRLGNAAIRSRMKRLIREGFRLNKHLLTSGHDIVVLPRHEWTDLRLAAIEAHFRRVFEELCASGAAR
jgi:ribonuclease P protein component